MASKHRKKRAESEQAAAAAAESLNVGTAAEDVIDASRGPVQGSWVPGAPAYPASHGGLREVDPDPGNKTGVRDTAGDRVDHG